MTTTAVNTKRSLSFTSEGVDQLETALGLFFGEAGMEAGCLSMVVDDWGVHLSLPGSGPAMRVLSVWERVSTESHYNTAAVRIYAWLNSLTDLEKYQLNTSRPHMPGSSTRPAHRLEGFTITSDRDDTDEHEMLTIIPGWV